MNSLDSQVLVQQEELPTLPKNIIHEELLKYVQIIFKKEDVNNLELLSMDISNDFCLVFKK